MTLVIMKYGEAGDHESGGEIGKISGDNDGRQCSSR